MDNTVSEVWKFLDSNPCIQRNLRQGLINSRALSRFIIKNKKLNTSLDAVISAIRRYNFGKEDNFHTTAYKLITKTINISTRIGLAEVTLIKDEDVQRLLPELFNVIEYIRGDVLRVIQANESVRLVVDERNLENIVEIFPREKIIKIEKNVGEINMNMHPKMRTTHGILAMISNELAANGINIVEVMSCFPELLFFVHEDDLVESYQILFNLCRN